MYLEEDKNIRQFRRELRSYFNSLLWPDVKEQIFYGVRGDDYRRVIRQLGRDNWLAMGWPEEYGGQGRSAQEQVVFFEEAALAGLPLPMITLNTVGPTLMNHGSEQHKKDFLPKIAAGTVYFAIGYSEPDSGTDLASLKTSAVRDGGDYIVNGTKVFTSGANSADYIWLAVRTDPSASPHKGISILMVDTRSEGFSCTPIQVVGNTGTTITYYDNVRVPASMLVGEENAGWTLITSQLNYERVGLAALGIEAMRLFDRTLDWLDKCDAQLADAELDPLGQTDRGWIKNTIAEAYARLEAMRLMNARMAWQISQNNISHGDASMVKVFGTENMIHVINLLIQVLGPLCLLQRSSEAAVLQGELEAFYQRCQILTFGGGVNEVQREIVASFALGMPRVRH